MIQIYHRNTLKSEYIRVLNASKKALTTHCRHLLKASSLRINDAGDANIDEVLASVSDKVPFCINVIFTSKFVSTLKYLTIIFKENTFLPFIDLPAGGDLQASKGPGQCSGQGTPKRNLMLLCDLVGGQQLAEFAIGFKYQPTAWGVR